MKLLASPSVAAAPPQLRVQGGRRCIHASRLAIWALLVLACRRDPVPPVLVGSDRAERSAHRGSSPSTELAPVARPATPTAADTPSGGVRPAAGAGGQPEDVSEVGAEGVLLGLDDGARILDLVAARLAREAPVLSAPGPQQWAVNGPSGGAISLAVDQTSAVWIAASDDLQLVLSRGTCAQRVVPPAGPALSAPCRPEMAAEARLAALLPVLARRDLRPLLRLEGLQWSGQGATARGTLRLSAAALGARWQIEVGDQGRLLSAELAGSRAELTWLSSVAHVRLRSGLDAQWSWPAPSDVRRIVLRIATDGTPDFSLKWLEAARVRHLQPLGPLQVEFNWTGTALEFRAVSGIVAARLPAADRDPEVVAVPVQPVALPRVLWMTLATASEQLQGLPPGCYLAQILGNRTPGSDNSAAAVVLRNCMGDKSVGTRAGQVP